jgi:DNA-binding transcriptional regulator of glucitol operon
VDYTTAIPLVLSWAAALALAWLYLSQYNKVERGY